MSDCCNAAPEYTAPVHVRAGTRRHAVQGKTAFWLQDLGRSGEVPVRRRSSVLKRLPRRPCLRILLAKFLVRSVESPQVIAPFQPTRRLNLGLVLECAPSDARPVWVRHGQAFAAARLMAWSARWLTWVPSSCSPLPMQERNSAPVRWSRSSA